MGFRTIDKRRGRILLSHATFSVQRSSDSLRFPSLPYCCPCSLSMFLFVRLSFLLCPQSAQRSSQYSSARLLPFLPLSLSLSLYACVCVCWLPASAINLQQLKIKLIKIYVQHIFALGLAQRRISVPLETCVKNVLLLLPPVCFTYI